MGLSRGRSAGGTTGGRPGGERAVLDRLNALDVCFALDATGSMVPWIKQVTAALTDVVATVARAPSRPDLRLALVEYRDHPQGRRAGKAADSPVTSHAFVTDVRAFARLLRAVRCTGGDDGPEAVADGLDVAVRLPWRQYAQKVCVLMGDAPPHGAGAPGDAFPAGCPCGRSLDAVARAGAGAGIVVHGVAVTDNAYVQAALRSAAEVGGGEFFTLTDTARLVRVLTEVAVVEAGKVAADIDVAGRYDGAGGDAARIARDSGRSEEEVRASIERLRAKAAIGALGSAGGPATEPGPAPTGSPDRPSRVRLRR